MFGKYEHVVLILFICIFLNLLFFFFFQLLSTLSIFLLKTIKQLAPPRQQKQATPPTHLLQSPAQRSSSPFTDKKILYPGAQSLALVDNVDQRGTLVSWSP